MSNNFTSTPETNDKLTMLRNTLW